MTEPRLFRLSSSRAGALPSPSHRRWRSASRPAVRAALTLVAVCICAGLAVRQSAGLPAWMSHALVATLPIVAAVALLLTAYEPRRTVVRQERRARRLARADDLLDFDMVLVDELQPGDVILCTAGNTVAVDGEVVDGRAFVDEPWRRGPLRAPESRPVCCGATVRGGSTVRAGFLVVRIGPPASVRLTS